MNKAEQLLKSMLEATERRAEQAEGDLYDARVDNRMLAARAEQAEATLNAIERLLDVPGMGTGWEAIKALKFRAEQAEAELRKADAGYGRVFKRMTQAEALLREALDVFERQPKRMPMDVFADIRAALAATRSAREDVGLFWASQEEE